jgi:MYXO-CTERM domain-containing protein
VGSVKLTVPSEPLELVAGFTALAAALWRRRRRR